ncbi:MAG: hypothetical protein ACLSSW_05860, partial [Acutalibacteraceae bacterium]
NKAFLYLRRQLQKCYCFLNGENNSKNNKTALIATIVSVAATVVVTAAIAIACYFKNPSSFPCFRTSDETVEV